MRRTSEMKLADLEVSSHHQSKTLLETIPQKRHQVNPPISFKASTWHLPKRNRSDFRGLGGKGDLNHLWKFSNWKFQFDDYQQSVKILLIKLTFSKTFEDWIRCSRYDQANLFSLIGPLHFRNSIVKPHLSETLLIKLTLNSLINN